MARIRTIKPEFWTDSKTGKLPADAKCLFLGLLNHCDDYGVIRSEPIEFAAKIFPYQNPPESLRIVEEALTKFLLPLDLVRLFSFAPDDDEGKTDMQLSRQYLFITGFNKHQRVDKRGKSLISNWNPKMVQIINSDIPHEPPQIPTMEEEVGIGSSKGKELKPLSSDSKESKPDKFSEWDLGMAEAMRVDILQIAPKYKFKSTIESWANDIRLMRERDKRTEKEIGMVWLWANANSFWRGNILSPGKLREKFTQLTLKMNGNDANDGGTQSAPRKVVGGLPLPDQEPAGHNELASQISFKMAFCEDHINDTGWGGAIPDLKWLNLAVGKLILEYSERFPKGPHIARYTAWLDRQSEKVMNLIPEDAEQ